MRWVATQRFVQHVLEPAYRIAEVAVVGGSADDPEVRALLRMKTGATITWWGITPSETEPFHYLDLNEPHQDSVTHHDLVICCHVLEHVWDVKTALSNLIRLSKPSGLIWINCPASAHAHGSPQYYSAGYQPELISRLASAMGAETLAMGILGSPRSYFYEHTLRRWPSRDEFEAPIIRVTGMNYASPRSYLRWFRTSAGRMMAATKSPRVSGNPLSGTQTWLLLQAKKEACRVAPTDQAATSHPLTTADE